jgi:hypothetical protein
MLLQWTGKVIWHRIAHIWAPVIALFVAWVGWRGCEVIFVDIELICRRHSNLRYCSICAATRRESTRWPIACTVPWPVKIQNPGVCVCTSLNCQRSVRVSPIFQFQYPVELYFVIEFVANMALDVFGTILHVQFSALLLLSRWFRKSRCVMGDDDRVLRCFYSKFMCVFYSKFNYRVVFLPANDYTHV